MTDNPVDAKISNLISRSPYKSVVGGDLKRIMDLPMKREDYPTPELIRDVSDTLCTPESRAQDPPFELTRCQVEGFLDWATTGGVFGPIGVGRGKTLTSFLIAERCWLDGEKKILLLIPPSVYQQTYARDVPFERTRIKLTVPFIGLGGLSSDVRGRLAGSGRQGVYVFPYSLLSGKDGRKLLKDISPTIIIADECHQVSRPSAARTRRLLDYIRRQNPKCVWLSGTITNKSVTDYYELLRSALGDGAPIPLHAMVARDWGQYIDSTDDPIPGASASISPLMKWARKTYPDEKFLWNRSDIRKAFQRRLSSTPGVVSTGDKEIGSSLLITNQRLQQTDQELIRLLKKVDDDWETPSGDYIDWAIHKWKWLNELSAGFYNNLFWPDAEVLAERRGIDVSKASSLLDRSKDHHEHLQEYHKLLRRHLLRTQSSDLDTPFLVGKHLYNYYEGRNKCSVPSNLARAWKDAHDRKFPRMPTRDKEAVWVSDYKVDAAVAWAENEGRGILWYHNQAVGKRLSDRLPGSVWCPAGKIYNNTVLNPELKNSVIVASIRAHGQGKNLQHFHKSYVVQWPRPAKIAEQLIGRLHRLGQLEDEVEYTTNRSSVFDDMLFGACVSDALYIHQSLGTPQKLIYGDYNPVPVFFSNSILRERGLQPLSKA